MNRYRATIYVDLFEDDIELAKEEANRIIRKIYDSWVEEVKLLPHGSELTWDEGKEIINEI